MSLGSNPAFGWTYTVNAAPAVQAINQVTTAATALKGAANSSASAVQAFGHQASQSAKNVDVLGGAVRSVTGPLDALHGILARFVAIPAVFAAIAHSMGQLEERQAGLATKAEAWRDSLRELAAILGESGPKNSVMAAMLEIGTATGAVPDKARDLVTAYENIGPTVRAKHHFGDNEAAAKVLEREVLIEGGRMGRRLGMDEATTGAAIGTMGLFHKFGNKEQAMDMLAGAAQGISQGNLKFNEGFQALNKATSRLSDPDEAVKEGAKRGQLKFDEAGIMLGVLSLGTGGQADPAQHKMVQISRLVNASGKKQERALAEAGIRPGMDDAEKFIALAKHLSQQADPTDWLVKHKLGHNLGSREAVLSGMKNVDVLEQRLAEGKAKRLGADAIRRNQEHFKLDRAATNAEAKAMAGAQDIIEGERAEPMDIAKRLAEIRIRQKDPSFTNPITKAIRDYLVPLETYALAGVGGEDYLKEFGLKGKSEQLAAIPTLVRQGQAVGIDVATRFPGINARDPIVRKQAFGQAANAILGAGGDPYDRESVRAGVAEGIEGLRQGEPALPGGGVRRNRGAAIHPDPFGLRGGAAGAGGPRAAVELHGADDFGRHVDEFGAIVAQLQQDRRPPAPRGPVVRHIPPDLGFPAFPERPI